MMTELDRITEERGIVSIPQLLPIARLPEREEATDLIFARVTRGPITDDWFLDHLPTARRLFYQEGEGSSFWGNSIVRYEIVNHINGSRSALDIWYAVSSAYGAVPLSTVVTFLKDLQSAGLVTDIRSRSGHYQRQESVRR
jgi:hypothetical protein